MTTITTRSGKGSALTHEEMDSNFTNLNNNKLETFTVAGDVTGALASNVLTVNLKATQTTITTVGTLGSLSVTGNITAGNLQATALAGTLSTASQPNITTVGTLGSLAVTGAVTAGTVAAEFRNFRETAATLTYASTITPNVAEASIQTVTLTGNVTFNAFTSPVAGQSLILIVRQDGTGNRGLTSTMKFAGNSRTLSTAANAVDIVGVFYDGTNYWASLNKGFE